jgi:hypothetical protein
MRIRVFLNMVHPGFEWVMVESVGKGRPMQDVELYQHISGLSSPWTVRDVKLDIENHDIRV